MFKVEPGGKMNLAVGSQNQNQVHLILFPRGSSTSELARTPPLNQSPLAPSRSRTTLSPKQKHSRKRRIRFAIRLHSMFSMFPCLGNFDPYTWLLSSISSEMKRAKFYPECSGFLRTINVTLKRRIITQRALVLSKSY